MSEGLAGSPIVVDLFCGAGGLSSGLTQAGFNVVCGIDYDRHSLATYKLNHPDAITINSDISQVHGSEILRRIGSDEIDLVAGGPSCQGYSTHGKRIENDPRNFLFKHFVRLVDEIRPKFALVENVKGLLTYRSGYFADLIIDSFERIGYRVECKVLLAADYGVPQLRQRIFFLATRLAGVEISFPKPTHAPADLILSGLQSHVTVEEAIGDLPLLSYHGWRNSEYASAPTCPFQKYARDKRKQVSLHQATPPSDAALEVISLVGEGQGLRSIPLDKLPDRFKKMRRIKNGDLRKDCTTLYYRLDRKSPAYTITCNFRNVASGPFVHPLENRSLSFREAARLMSFQDSYEFVSTSLARQIGNAVPPLLAKAMGKQIISLLHAAEGRKTKTKKSPAIA